MSILKSASKFKRFQGGTKTPRGKQTHSQLDPISPQKTTLKTHTENITDLMVNMKFMVLPSLQ